MRRCQLTGVLDKQRYYTLIHENAFIQKRFFQSVRGTEFQSMESFEKIVNALRGIIGEGVRTLYP